ncbi:MAG: hypothetical protein ACRCTA_06695, partial [Bacilli bacterium]
MSIADNFSNVDKYISKAISDSNSSFNTHSFVPVKSYEVYLKKNEILDDVKDVLAAYDLQVENKSMQLSLEISRQYEDILTRYFSVSSKIIENISLLDDDINYLYNNLEATITSKKDNVEYDVRNNLENEEEITKNHGILSNFLGFNLCSSIKVARNDIIPLFDIFEEAHYIAKSFNDNISGLENYLKATIEKGVYHSMELENIITIQNGIGSISSKHSLQLSRAIEMIASELKGDSIKHFTMKISDINTKTTYFTQMLDECFG